MSMLDFGHYTTTSSLVWHRVGALTGSPPLCSDSGCCQRSQQTRQSLLFSVLWSSRACQLKICDHLIAYICKPVNSWQSISLSSSFCLLIILTDVFLPSLSLPEANSATPSDPARMNPGKSKEYITKEEELYAQYFTFWLAKSQLCQKKEVMGQRAKVGQRSNCRFSQSFGRHEYETSSPHCSTPICRVHCWVNLTLGLPYVVSTMSSVAYQCFIMKVCMAERGDMKH